jgi:polysaccharide biosynthesis protein PslH
LTIIIVADKFAKSMEKVLVVSPFVSWPLSQGSIVRTHYTVRWLSQQHTVYFACRGGPEGEAIPGVEATIVNNAHRYWQLLNPIFLYRLWRLIRQEQINMILVSQLWSGLHGLLLNRLNGIPLVFDNHNVEYVRLRRSGSLFWPFVACLEFVTCHLAQTVICVSEVDKARLAQAMRLNPKKIRVAVNGVDVSKFSNYPYDAVATRQALGLDPDTPFVLFFGSLDHRPNAQAADIILAEIAPRLKRLCPAARLVLVGLGAEAYQQSRSQPAPRNVRFAGFVADITAVIKGADLVIVPLTAGSGTRYKIIESIACGRRVISTTIGAEGLDLALLGQAVTICDDWEQFSHEIAAQLAHPREIPLPLGFAATYDWAAIFGQLDLDERR